MQTLWLFSLLATLFALPLRAQQMQEVRTHQVFEVAGTQRLQVRIDDSRARVNLRETYSSLIVVEIIVQSQQKTQRELQELVRSEFFHLQSSADKEQKILLLTPSLLRKNAATFPATTSDLQIIYNIAVPEYVAF